MSHVVRTQSFQLGDQTYEDIWFTSNEGRGRPSDAVPGYGWEMEVPAVLRILDDIAQGRASAVEARQLVVEAVTYASGCCSLCDEVGLFYEDALHRHRLALEAWSRTHGEYTTESHPYVIGKSGKIHSVGCHLAGKVEKPAHPGATLHQFALAFVQFGGEPPTLDAFFARYADMPASTRATAREVAGYAAGRRRDVRCKACAPSLPAAWTSESSDVQTGVPR